jgi:quercetin dioxygenase-like cupin family protein
MVHVLPSVIENGQGERLEFLEVVQAPEGETLLVRNELQPGCGPIMHVHFQQEEALTVRDGRLGYQFEGEDPQVAGPGETVVFERGRPHRFWADGDAVLRCDGYLRPPHNVVWFLSEVYRSTAESGKGKPDDFDSAYLLGRYRNEYDMPAIPAPVRRLVFPILRMIGKFTGRFRRFEGAPTPIGPA